MELEAITIASTGIVLTKVDLILVELGLDELDPLGVSVELVCPLGVERLKLALDPTGEGELALFELAPRRLVIRETAWQNTARHSLSLQRLASQRTARHSLSLERLGSQTTSSGPASSFPLKN